MTCILSPMILLILSKLLLCKADSAAIFNGDEWVKVVNAKSGLQPPPPITYDGQDSNGPIFVAIASFRDERCPITIQNVFSKAENPNRVYVGLLDQVHTEEDKSTCIKKYCEIASHGSGECPHKNQIKYIVMSFQDSRGPSYARSFHGQMIDNEEFCMQIDAHTDFVKNWDIQMISMWQGIGNEYGVLSTKLPPISSIGANIHGHYEVPHLCQATFTESGIVRNLSPRAAMNLESPLLSPLWSASYSFSKCHAEIKTPSDPNYLYIYDGEEFTKYVRLWTRGYDVYTPSRILLGHDTEGKMKEGGHNNIGGGYIGTNMIPSEWMKMGMKDTYRWDSYSASLLRMKTLLGIEGGDFSSKYVSTLTKYGLGMKRTLDQFIEFTGVDTRHSIVYGDRCKELSWVPFNYQEDLSISPYIDTSDIWGTQPIIYSKNGPNIPLISGKIEYQSFDTIIQDAPMTDSNGHIVRGSSSSSSSHHIHVPESIEKVEVVVEGELWWIFQSIDQSIEALIERVDKELGDGHGHRVLKVVLLLCPLVAFLLYFSLSVVMGGGAFKSLFDERMRADMKKI